MADMKYTEFIETKLFRAEPAGFELAPGAIHPALYDFQRSIVRWAVQVGRCALFEDCGLGKTVQQIEWARIIGGVGLIVAPLSVTDQTISEARRLLGVEVRYITSPDDIESDGLYITNYERVRAFAGDPRIRSMVLDESSILKSIDGKTRAILVDGFGHVQFKLCATATPCPNDISELANHAAFLGVMTRAQMLATFFVHDQDGWRMRGHATDAFYRWLTSWAIALKRPDDLGFDGRRYRLPDLNIIDSIVETEWRREGELFPGAMSGIVDRAAVRRSSIADRVDQAVSIVEQSSGPVIVWCGLNDESDMVSSRLSDAVQISGNDSPESKRDRLAKFKDGWHRVLVTKPKIAGFGMNFQNASTMVFVGLSDSYETYYQCIRRCWRFGQRNAVDVYVVVTDHEVEIVQNVRRKEIEAERLSAEIVAASKKYEMEALGMGDRDDTKIERRRFTGDGWEIIQGDCVEESRKLADDSIDLSVFSPPFLALYQYSEYAQDMGNCGSRSAFFDHFRFLINELLRATKPGRICAVHCAQVPQTLINDGVIGVTDFRGDLIREFVDAGFIYHGEVCIDKCPQAQAIRTKAKGLMFVQLRKDSSWSRPGLADYILAFRAPGSNAVPVNPDITNDQWIQWARPIWYGIQESNTLNGRDAKADKDDKHICPLQLETIERCIRLWSNPGDVVLSPFAGIGSEIYQAINLRRRGIGFELKPLYAETAAKNCRMAENSKDQPELFPIDGPGIPEPLLQTDY